jgi:hypothetical protein
MNSQVVTTKKAELVFPRSTKHDAYLPKDLSEYKANNFFRLFSVDVNQIEGWFGQYDVDSIELWVNSIIQTEETTRLIIGNKLEGGLKV